MGLRGAGGVKNFSVGICNGAPSTARSSFLLNSLNLLKACLINVLCNVFSMFDWILYAPVNNFLVIWDGCFWVEPVLSKD